MSLGTTASHVGRSHMKPQASEAFAAFVGLDWADAKHDVCLQAAGTEQREFLSLEHSPEAINAWVQTLRTRFNGQPVAVCLELNKGPIVSALYIALQIAYSFWLKNIVIIDVFAIAAGFVLRTVAGIVVIHIANFSPWLYVCAG